MKKEILVRGDIVIRAARPDDAEILLEIYAPYVRETAITFEYDVPQIQEFAERIRHTLGRYPYLVAVRGKEICGYAYASSFHARKAYSWAAEASVYVRRDLRGQGIGKILYECLEQELKRQHIINLNACIAVTERTDEHLNNDSQNFHRHMGYRLVGTFHSCGYKFGKWYDMIWMEKTLGEHPTVPEEVVPWSRLAEYQ